jgi:hypothetical protein
MKEALRILCLALLLATLANVAVMAGTAETEWKQETLNGVYEDVPPSQRGGNGGMPFACYPPCDRICAVILWRPNPTNGLYSSGPQLGTMVGVWIPSLNKGYSNVRYHGMVVGQDGNSLRVYLSETPSTLIVNSQGETKERME